ncbi:MAG: isochorismatase family protein [Bacillus sp. (in: firmicutes)]
MSIPKIKPYCMPNEADMPSNRVLWKADPKRAVLLIHDMQQYFVDYYTPNASPVTELIERITALKEECVKMGIPVVYTAQPGSQKPEDRALLTDFWGPGLEDDIQQTKIIDELSPDEGDIVQVKWRYSAFKKSDLLEQMNRENRDQLIICGVYAHIGCLVTTMEAFMYDIQAFFVADAVADFTFQHHREAIKYAAERCAMAVTTENLIGQLKDSEESPLALEKIKKQVAEVLDIDVNEIGDHDDFLDLGLDSIRMMSIAEAWRDAGIDVSFTELAEKPNAASWEKLVSCKTKQVLA